MYAEMMPRIQAMETALEIDALIFASGRMPDGRAYVADLRRRLSGGQEPHAPKASIAQMQAAGINVVREEVKS